MGEILGTVQPVVREGPHTIFCGLNTGLVIEGRWWSLDQNKLECMCRLTADWHNVDVMKMWRVTVLDAVTNYDLLRWGRILPPLDPSIDRMLARHNEDLEKGALNYD